MTDSQRRDVHRRLQQRPGRRARAPAGQRGDRRPGPAAEHQPALPAPARHRARRAPGGHDAGRARHRPPRELRQRGDRPGLAAGDRRHGSHRRPGHRLRLPRRHDGDGGAVARGVARRPAARPRRAVRRATRTPARPGVVRRRRRPVAGGRARAGPRHRRPGVHQRRHPRARARRTTRPWAAAARDAGALVVADEVQAGFGRTGDHLWSFVGAGLVPDVVTLGKPMGNGYPIAAVVTRSSYVEALGGEAEFFSTFAGSPVAAVAGARRAGRDRRPRPRRARRRDGRAAAVPAARRPPPHCPAVRERAGSRAHRRGGPGRDTLDRGGRRAGPGPGAGRADRDDRARRPTCSRSGHRWRSHRRRSRGSRTSSPPRCAT